MKNIKRINLVSIKENEHDVIGQVDYIAEKTYIECKAYIPCSWNTDGSVASRDFFAIASVKWDGCSHFWFKGERYPYEEDGYYHVCGTNTYLNHMRMMQFILEVAVMEIGDKFFDLELNDLKKLRKFGLLDDYKMQNCDIESWELKDLNNEWEVK
ncbi:hypothetical protein [Lysinibacillus sp. BPa_S21]|uniref:hypothetical protein n=1 Tax=Lysinibacillus sp. BPa_S21 TaxID=2932478 RepID=UPI002012FF94|nr:hypothetical protein [Lysinibacillus sp. BPa_S21]MCL1696354.1 hypothetical protein [Lysinibacillus sp. BPa_S21]